MSQAARFRATLRKLAIIGSSARWPPKAPLVAAGVCPDVGALVNHFYAHPGDHQMFSPAAKTPGWVWSAPGPDLRGPAAGGPANVHGPAPGGR